MVDKYSVISSVYGKIQQVLLSYPAVIRDECQIVHRFQGIFDALPGDVAYIVLAQFEDGKWWSRSLPAGDNSGNFLPDTCDSDEDGRNAEHLTLAIIEPTVNYTDYIFSLLSNSIIDAINDAEHGEHIHSEWVQDPFMVMRNTSGQHALLEPMFFINSNVNRLGDQLVADYLAAFEDFVVKPFPLQLEGGNILIGDNYAFVGSETLVKNWNGLHRKMKPTRIHELFQSYLGVDQVFWIGSARPDEALLQPENFHDDMFLLQLLPHIDMYLTLAGKSADGRELVFVADLREDTCFGVNKRVQTRFRTYFQSVADSLAACETGRPRFQVERLPIMMHNHGDRFFMSFNNCLVEVYDDKKNVYIPNYEPEHPRQKEPFARITQEVRSTFARHGFSVQMVQSQFNTRARSNCSLHCILKVLRRGDRDFELKTKG